MMAKRIIMILQRLLVHYVFLSTMQILSKE